MFRVVYLVMHHLHLSEGGIIAEIVARFALNFNINCKSRNYCLFVASKTLQWIAANNSKRMLSAKPSVIIVFHRIIRSL
jgi:hypothetical protein